MYFSQLDYETEECFLCVVAEEIVIEHDIKFHSENEQEVIDFCGRWNRNEFEKYYVYDTGYGFGIATQKQPDCKLIDIFTDENEAKDYLIKLKGKMNFNEFAEYVKDNIWWYLKPYSIESIYLNRKLNMAEGVYKIEMRVFPVDERFSINIFLEKFHTEYVRGTNIETILEKISNAFMDGIDAFLTWYKEMQK